MSNAPIARSADLRRLRDEGYDIEASDGFIRVKHVPYVNEFGEVKHDGILSAPFDLDGDTAIQRDHTVYFTGDYPADAAGKRLTAVVNRPNAQSIGDGLNASWYLSSKPDSGHYDDFHHKFTHYAHLLADSAAALDPAATARTYPVHQDVEDDSPFVLQDTASSRAGILAPAARLKGQRIAIVGLGGTGSYVLDFVAKTRVAEIHLYDDDEFIQHNAYRSPGFPTQADLSEKKLKIDYLAGIYDHAHKRITRHPVRLSKDNADDLSGFDMVFLCTDAFDGKDALLERLEQLGISYIDTGMGLSLDDNEQIGGTLRVTTSTPRVRKHVHERDLIPLNDAGEDIYSSNIQVVELNALGASLAVIKWKKLNGFYRDLEAEHHSLFTIDGNHLLNEVAAD
ncbi:ThiF family adenylyltransferase [Humibacter sp.]|uniref:ThiF family adenylyltransferase n=1 Tax=Humibacter sp. TaxID=1940291 RepID=UPI003F808A7F